MLASLTNHRLINLGYVFIHLQFHLLRIERNNLVLLTSDKLSNCHEQQTREHHSHSQEDLSLDPGLVVLDISRALFKWNRGHVLPEEAQNN